MKLKKRKIKYSAIFFLCWFAFLVFLVDGVLKFQTLVDYFGSYALVEVALLLLVILPTSAVYRLTKEKNNFCSTETRRRCYCSALLHSILHTVLCPDAVTHQRCGEGYSVDHLIRTGENLPAWFES